MLELINTSSETGFKSGDSLSFAGKVSVPGRVFSNMKGCKSFFTRGGEVVQGGCDLLLERGQEEPHPGGGLGMLDATCETEESKKGVWAPESAALQRKMICASSKDAIEEKLMGIKNELRENRYKETYLFLSLQWWDTPRLHREDTTNGMPVSSALLGTW
ncbi:Cofilin-1 [Camelus dromedarius]|uniref:Cofilin-1 n=1 Tax=Camelus dromedarius TaxID=9838 RepID=A0A5N4CBD4_CAMDR|nr:Cofilin-1 [Camelus dromedarius]